MEDRIQQGALTVKSAAKSTFLFLLCSAVAFSCSTAAAQTQRSSQPRSSQPRTPSNRGIRTAAQPRSPVRTAQAQTGRRTGPVAVVDVSRIFQNHEGFKRAMEGMKKEVQQYEDSLRARHQALTKKKEELANFRPGTREYVTRERAIADETAKLSVDTQLKKKEFLEREARVYYRIYEEVTRAIQEYASRTGISLVLRYNGQKMNPEDRNSVLAGVNRAIVYQNNLDITSDIIDRLNRLARKPAAPSGARR